MPIDNSNDEFKMSFDQVTYQIPRSSSNIPDFVNKNSPNTSNEMMKIKSSILDPPFNNCSDTSTASNLLQCMSDNDSNNSTSVNLPDMTGIEKQKLKHEIIAENVSESHETKKLNLEVVTNVGITVNENIKNISNDHQCEMHLGNLNVGHNTYEMILTEYNANCPHLSFDDSNDSFNSESLSDVEEKYRNEKFITQQSSSKLVDKSMEIIGNDEKEARKKEKKKNVKDVNECSLKDLYNKENDYIHSLFMKELVSSMGKLRIQHVKDHRVHQTNEKCSGYGEYVIEVYGFSSDLKTVDLINLIKFAGFREHHFEIICVDDTHALAVFESPNLADRVLNTPIALLKTRPLKNAIKESKLRAETVVPLLVTSPETQYSNSQTAIDQCFGTRDKYNAGSFKCKTHFDDEC